MKRLIDEIVVAWNKRNRGECRKIKSEVLGLIESGELRVENSPLIEGENFILDFLNPECLPEDTFLYFRKGEVKEMTRRDEIVSALRAIRAIQ